MSKPSVALLTGVLPAPADQGDRLRLRALLSALARQGTVRVAYIGREAEAAREAFAPFTEDLWVYPLPLPRALMGAALGLGRHPVTLSAHVHRSLLERLRRDWASQRVPALQVAYQLKMAPYGAALPAGVRVVDLTDRLTSYLERARQAGAGPLLRLRLAGIGRAEEAVRSLADQVWLAAAEEAAAFGPGARLVPNGTDVPPAPLPFPAEVRRLLFVGNRLYPPNRDGLEWFLRQVWPLLRRQEPELQLDIIGKGPPATGEGIWDHGRVADLSPFYARCGVAIAPLRFGAGTRLKILEALAWGRPVVSTPAGAEGLPAIGPEQETPLLRAADAAAFADGVLGLLRHPQDLRQRGIRGHRWAAAEASWERIMDRAVGEALGAAAGG